MSRIENSLKNYMSNLTITITSNLLNVISRTIFIYILGADYLGINGLFSNLLAMLSLAELGIGSAINFSLYKPIAEHDEEKIVRLMQFYKKCYRVIAMIVFGIGILMMLFLDILVKDPGDVENLHLIFFIYVLNTSYSYLMSYKNTLLSASQKDYMLMRPNLIFSIVNIVVQVIILIITKNYICYLVSNMVILFIQRMYINCFITKEFPILRQKTKDRLEETELNVIVKNVKAMLWHKLGEYCINSTDNIIISMFLSIKLVGYYSNYLLIINMVNAYVHIIFNNMTASMGDLIASEAPERRWKVFKKVNFLGMWLYGFVAICFYILLNPFIELWLGAEYVLQNIVVITLVFTNYMSSMRIPPFIVKSAAGLYAEDKFVPILQSIINLVISIGLAKTLGLVGVFLGTLISGILPSFYRPYLIYKKVFFRKSMDYFKDYLWNSVLLMVIVLIIEGICNMFFGIPKVIVFLIKMLLCVVITNFIFWRAYHNRDEYLELKEIGRGILNKICKR